MFPYPLKEFREPKDRLAYWMPWAYMADDGLVVNKDGSLQATFVFRGPDLASATDVQLRNLSAQVNSIFMRLGTGWCFYSDVVRHTCDKYMQNNIDNYMARNLDEERKRHFLKGNHFENISYFTMIYLPPPTTQNKLLNLMVDNAGDEKDPYQDVLDTFINEGSKIFETLKFYLGENGVRKLSNEEILSYYHNCVSDKRTNLKEPEEFLFLDAYITDSPLISGFKPILGKKHVRCVSILRYPSHSVPCLLDALNRLGFEYRWTSRYIALDKTDARKMVDDILKRWKQGTKGLMTRLSEIAYKRESSEVNEDMVYRSEEVKHASFLLETDAVSMGYYTMVVTILDEDETIADRKAALVEKTINGLGFTCLVEYQQATEAFLSSIPGMCRANIRRDLTTSINFTHFFPLSSPWAGPQYNYHLNGPPLIYTETIGSTPFRFDLHGEKRDTAHTMIIGPTGAGKSVFLNLLEASYLKYPNAKVFIFDKGASSRVTTLCAGGKFYNLGNEKSSELSLQPFANIHIPSERRWAKEWLINYLEASKLNITPEMGNLIETALSELALQNKEYRTLSGFWLLIQDNDIKEAIQPLCKDHNGVYAELFDSNVDGFSSSKWQVFEMETLMSTPTIVMPVLDYLFHKIELVMKNNFDEDLDDEENEDTDDEVKKRDPTIIILDECWVFLAHKIFAQKIKEWLKVLRKYNGAVVFATQSLSDVAESEIAPAIRESCPTKIFLPNLSAQEKTNAAFYSSFGLNEQEIELIAKGTPKQDYYYKSPEGSRIFQLALGKQALAYVASTSSSDVMAAENILKECINDSELGYDIIKFNNKWLEHKNAYINETEKIVKQLLDICKDNNNNHDIERFTNDFIKWQKDKGVNYA